ncbi:hypothetical protein TrVE_jg6589 [Triparma verrucosa]|uniref:TBC1 domain family member 31 n=1 Tax=Triparma verrucosa TaxID=1606542 RepID=A0A9W6ZA94_9STRA|nr:hypothetical protein TrVE_jg6589 [Triparma verrucosa]
MPAPTIPLHKSSGRIWTSKPEISTDGHLSTFVFPSKSKDGKDAKLGFSKTAFALGSKASFTATDGRGAVWTFSPPSNSFKRVSAPSSSGSSSRLLGPCTSITYRPPSSSTILTGHSNGSITRVITDRGEVNEHRTNSHNFAVRYMSSSGGVVLSVSQDKAVVWRDEGEKLRVVRSMSGDFRMGRCVSCRSSIEVGLLFADSSIAFYDADCFAMTRQYSLPATEGEGNLTCFDVSFDGRYLVAAGNNAMLYLYDLESDVLLVIAEMPPSAAAVVQLEFEKSPNGGKLFVLGDDGRILALDFTPAGCTVLFEIVSRDGAFTHFSIDRPCKYLVASTSTGTLRLYDLSITASTAKAVEEARRRMGMPSDQIVMSLHTRTPFISNPGAANSPMRPPPVWASHADPADHEAEVVGDVKSELIEGVFGAPSNTFKKGRSRTNKERLGREALSRATMDYDKVLPQAAKNVGRWEPLYRLAKLDPSDSRLNKRKLRTLLDSYGEYPAKYRLLCWRFLLQLPENHDAFALLANKDTHPAFGGLKDRYPLKNQRTFKKLQAVLSSLAHWSPVFGEAEYVPALAYPFVSLFQVDDLAAFETVMAVLLHWGGTWLTTFPHPPIPILNTVEQIIHSHDPKLMSHLVTLEVSSSTYAWSLLRSVFTEVLNKGEWLRLWDHLFTNSHDPVLLLCAVAAYSIYNRNALVAATSASEVEPFYHRQNPINMSDFVLLMYELRRKTPTSVLPKPGFGLLGEDVVDNNSKPTKLSKEGQEAEEGGNVLGSVLSAPDTPWPLPRGMYPAFHGYPKFVVDFQIAERQRLAAEEEEVRRKRRLLEALSERSRGLAYEEEAWQKQQETLVQAEEMRRKTADEEERKRLEEEKKLDDVSRERRLAQIEAMEEAAQSAMKSSSKLREAESKRIEDEMLRIRQKAEYTLKQRMEEEALLNLENQASTRVRQLQSSRSEEERARELRAELKAKEDKMILDDKILMDRLKIEDEERRLAAELERAKREKLAAMQSGLKTQQEINTQFVSAAAEREAKLAEVERERRLRHLAEDEAKRKAEEIELLEKQAEIEKQQEVADMEQLIRDARSWRTQQAAERMSMVEEERRRYLLESEVREKRLEEISRIGRRREYEKSMVEAQQEEIAKTLEEEKTMQQALLTMEQDRVRDRLHELRISLQEEERKERSSFQQTLQSAEERIVSEERRRFIQIREELRGRAAEQEKEIAAAHESRMQALAEEQQQEMDRIKEMIRKKVQLQEAQSLATKYTEGAEGVGEGGSGDDSVLERAKKTLSRVEGKK